MVAAVVVLLLAASTPTQFPCGPCSPPAFVLQPCPCPPAACVPVRRGPIGDIVLLWNDLALNAVRAERTPPPVAPAT